ncbi:sensor domain-containing phosphodiesterase [Stenotrophomonas sp. PS02301]|uniref:bifunctional diguanylate cyclase/phosphodiesterase n=1 Tax=Stenotrophomonas sp. PS02301 TaxID=2991427 RepID=UPI00249AB8A1|nr:sensor domain-containing phosphodiesterase [Stenotrophomonas sp. PS02301]
MTPPTSQRDERSAVLSAMQLDGLASVPALDRLTALAGYTFDAPVAFVSILGDVEQRFLSRIGLPMAQTDIRASICAHAVTSEGVLVVPDLQQDPRFRDNPLVTHSPHLRFYAGAPLVAKNGVPIGALCIMDTRPRTFDQGDQEQLSTLAELVVAQLELRAMSGRLDPVSGLPSRHQFHADLPGILARCAQGTAYAVAVDILDIPRANQVGQVLGLRPLEALIRRGGVRLRAALEGVATVYHVGVTRFAFVVEMPAAAQVEALILELRTRMLRPLMAAAVPMSPRFHAGICAVDPGEEDSHDLLRRLLVSTQGAFDARQPFCWYSEQRDDTMHRAYRLASDAERGLQAGDFHLDYQPRFTLDGRRPVSAEALIRWNHPTLGPISPGEFIPVFERTALMDEVTHWVLDTALDQVQAWRAQGQDIPVSINLSSSYLSNASAWQDIRSKLEHRALPFSMIELEITEGEWLRPGSPAIGHIAAMAQAGITVAIDDFGSGYSNFSYLSDLPIHTVKLDKSLIDGIASSSRARAKVSAIHHLAHELGYLTVAEGVEHQAQVDVLAAMGVDEVQGYLLARPMAPAAVMQVFEQAAITPRPVRV